MWDILRLYRGRIREALLLDHKWELPVNYSVFTVLMLIYHYIESILRILVTPNFFITNKITKSIIQVNK